MRRALAGGALLCVAATSWPDGARAQSAPAEPPPAAPPPFVQPETGVPVEFDSDRPASVFVAWGAIEDHGPQYLDPFVKLGRTPFSVKLAPGVYTMSAESPDIATGSTVFVVGSQPVHVRVRTGSSGSRGLGTLLLAIGAAGVLSGLVIELSHSEAADGINKHKIAIPMFVAGGVGVLGGLTIYLTSGTTIEQDGLKADRRGAFIGVTSRW
jgi:hypothetical protein